MGFLVIAFSYWIGFLSGLWYAEYRKRKKQEGPKVKPVPWMPVFGVMGRRGQAPLVNPTLRFLIGFVMFIVMVAMYSFLTVKGFEIKFWMASLSALLVGHAFGLDGDEILGIFTRGRNPPNSKEGRIRRL